MEKIKWVLNQMPKNEDKNLAVMALDNVNQARKFLSKGDKLKVSIRLRGREMAHPELGETNMQRFADELSEEAIIDKKPKLEGRQILMFMSPKTK